MPSSQRVLGAPTDGSTRLQTASFTLDNVYISLVTPFLPSPTFTTSGPGDASQVAESLSWNPVREFSVTGVPFNTKPGTEAVPKAQRG
jgi:hypothetical protein